MDFAVPKCVNGEKKIQRVSIEEFCVKSQFILENDFLSITRKKCIIGQNELGVQISGSKTVLGEIFEKNFLGPQKNFGPFSQRK